MAGELVSFGIQKLWDLLSHEYEQFQGVEDQVNELKTDLNTLKSFLKDAEAKKHTSEVVRNCVERINEIVLDGEDTIETLILKDELGKHSRIRRLACIAPERRNAALEIGSLSERIVKVVRDMKDFGVQQIIVDGRDPQPSKQRLEFAGKHESNLVGMEENVKTLIGYLVEQDDVQVVSVTGMGGLGKTTLARQAFHDKLVKKKFDRLAWVCVSQVCDRMKVWQAILQSFRPKEEQIEIQNMTEVTLQGELFRFLETSNSLIVLDDIWKEEDWDMIKPIFPQKAGSKVLLTSRNERVAGLGETYINFKPECLSDQDSWTLFQSIAMPRKDASELTPDDDEKMEKLGKEMLEHCLGLPLAVRVLGGLLAKKYTTHNWKRLSENIRSHIIGRTSEDKNNSLNHILSLSFEELPGHLKFCFLYLAHFPEDYEIDVEDLSYYWAAEGILRYETGDSIRDVGDNYMEELVRRNMVISETEKATGRFETCSLHDLMREICLSKAKEENFLHIIGVSSPTSHSHSLSTTSRRFVSHDAKALDVERDIDNSKVRSLVVISERNVSLTSVLKTVFFRAFSERWVIKKLDSDQVFWSFSNSGFKRLQLLRVLHLRGFKFRGRRFANSIGELIHLRYLNLEDSRVSHFPSTLRNLKLLIYLNLNVVGCSHLPTHTCLLGMKELRYLALPRRMRKKTKLELNHLVNLETLVNFSTEYCHLEDIRGMARLRTLGIKITGETSLETLSASIDGLSHLETLDIDYEGAKGTKEWSTLLEFNNLKRLELSTYIPLLSDELQFPSRLTSLCLWVSGLKEDPMPMLEKLVHLKDVKLSYGSFSGRRMVCLRGGFPQLQKLELQGLEEWEEWIIEEGSMPLLHSLVIRDCGKLKEIPDGLPFITSLKNLTVVLEEEEEWKKRLSEGGEDYFKVQHIPSVKVYELRDYYYPQR